MNKKLNSTISLPVFEEIRGFHTNLYKYKTTFFNKQELEEWLAQKAGMPKVPRSNLVMAKFYMAIENICNAKKKCQKSYGK